MLCRDCKSVAVDAAGGAAELAGNGTAGVVLDAGIAGNMPLFARAASRSVVLAVGAAATLF